MFDKTSSYLVGGTSQKKLAGSELRVFLYQEHVTLFVLALLLMGVERFIPRLPLIPWLKLGLVHIVTLVWIIRYGIKSALFFTFARIWLGALFFGFNLFTVGLGGLSLLVAIVAMGLVVRLLHSFVGLVGVAVVGALVHNSVQLSLLYSMFGSAVFVSEQLPFMLLVSVVTGVVTALGSRVVLQESANYTSSITADTVKKEQTLSFVVSAIAPGSARKLIALGLIIWAIALFSFDGWGLLLSYGVLSIWSVVLWRTFSVLTVLRQSWLFLLLLFLGAYISFGGYAISSVALQLAILLVTKLLFWLLLSPFLSYYGADILMFRLLEKLGGEGRVELQTALVLVALFPVVVDELSRFVVARKWKLVLEPLVSLEHLLQRAEAIVLQKELFSVSTGDTTQ